MIDPTTPEFLPIPPAPAADPYRAALKCTDGERLREVAQAIGIDGRGWKPTQLVEAIAERLAEPGEAGRLLAGLGPGPRLAMGLFGLAESAGWPLGGLELALGSLGVGPAEALGPLLDLGLLARRAVVATDGTDTPEVAAHPAALATARTVLPEAPGPPQTEGGAKQVREADGLEPILRLAALWQRLDEAPLRQTMQNSLYKRDRERLEDDPALAGPIADALEPLPDMVPLWLALARAVGLITPEPGTDRIVAAPPEFWADNAVHLPQMLAARWLALRTWHEQGGSQQDGATATLSLPFVRPAALLWLATLPADAWVAVEDLAAHITALHPGWDRPTLGPDDPAATQPQSPAKSRGGRRSEKAPARPIAEGGPLAALLLGPAYQLGLVRAASEEPGGRRVVQLSPLGRYVLALGPPPPPRPHFEHFLFVQPNFEIIAYRQGLTPPLIGQLSRFLHWSRVGAALELRLTAESVYRGLEGGLTPGPMLERMTRHSSRPLPTGVAEAIRTWAGRRQRVTFHAAATLMEFASEAALEAALETWPPGDIPPVRITGRLLLVEDEASIPFQRFRMAGARDYRRPPEPCVEVEPGGVGLVLDLAKTDLFVDAELARFAEEVARDDSIAPGVVPRRRFRVTPASLARAAADGQTTAQLARWFPLRTGGELPPAIRLLLHAAGPGDAPPLATTRPLLLHAPSADLLDGLLQHPATRGLLGLRLGPTTAIIPDDQATALRMALAEFGMTLLDPAAE